jgi:hypothetical protein
MKQFLVVSRRQAKHVCDHGRKTKVGHGLLKVSQGPTMPNPSSLSWWVTPETALHPIQGSPTRKVGGLQSSFTPLDTSRRTPTYVCDPFSGCQQKQFVAKTKTANCDAQMTSATKTTTSGKKNHISSFFLTYFVSFPYKINPCGDRVVKTKKREEGMKE